MSLTVEQRREVREIVMATRNFFQNFGSDACVNTMTMPDMGNFDPLINDPLDFIDRVEEIGRQYPEGKVLLQFYLALKGTARDWYANLRRRSVNSLIQIIENFRDRYVDSVYKKKKEDYLKIRKWEENENILDYFDEKINLIEKVNCDMVERDRVTLIIDGLPKSCRFQVLSNIESRTISNVYAILKKHHEMKVFGINFYHGCTEDEYDNLEKDHHASNVKSVYNYGKESSREPKSRSYYEPSRKYPWSSSSSYRKRSRYRGDQRVMYRGPYHPVHNRYERRNNSYNVRYKRRKCYLCKKMGHIAKFCSNKRFVREVESTYGKEYSGVVNLAVGGIRSNIISREPSTFKRWQNKRKSKRNRSKINKSNRYKWKESKIAKHKSDEIPTENIVNDDNNLAVISDIKSESDEKEIVESDSSNNNSVNETNNDFKVNSNLEVESECNIFNEENIKRGKKKKRRKRQENNINSNNEESKIFDNLNLENNFGMPCENNVLKVEPTMKIETDIETNADIEINVESNLEHENDNSLEIEIDNHSNCRKNNFEKKLKNIESKKEILYKSKLNKNDSKENIENPSHLDISVFSNHDDKGNYEYDTEQQTTSSAPNGFKKSYKNSNFRSSNKKYGHYSNHDPWQYQNLRYW